jgi:hypothetical protein
MKHFIYNDGSKNITGTITGDDIEVIKAIVPEGVGFYVYTDADVKDISAPVEAWELSGDYDGYGTYKVEAAADK